jgi:hypothetical protein
MTFSRRASGEMARRVERICSQVLGANAGIMTEVPSVMESPKATITAAGAAGRTSIDFSQNIEVVLPVNALPSAETDWSPAPLSVR